MAHDPVPFSEAAAKHALKMRLIWIGYAGAAGVTLVYSIMCALLFAFRGSLSFEAVLAIMGAFAPVYLTALNHFLKPITDGAAFAFGSSQSSSDEKGVSQTLASAANRMAAEGVTRAATDAVAAGVPQAAPGTVTTRETVTTLPAQPAPSTSEVGNDKYTTSKVENANPEGDNR